MKIVHYPHPALRTKAEPVRAVDKDLHLLVGNMLDLMYEAKGLGLAAPQVGVAQQVLVMNFAGDPERKDMEHVAINPVLVETGGGTVDGREGCLSFPELFQKVRRAKNVRVQAYNLKGEMFEMACEELAARVWQHEMDHLNGVLFIDKMSMLGRMNSRKALDEFKDAFDRALKRGDLPPGTTPKL